MNKKYVLTLHSFYGSAYEASCPQLTFGPFEEKEANELCDKMNDLLENTYKMNELMWNMSPLENIPGLDNKENIIETVLKAFEKHMDEEYGEEE